jgi:hypothetical protein
MIGMLRLSRRGWRADRLGNRRAYQQDRWHRFVTFLHHALLGVAPRIAAQATDDGEVFALQCAEAQLRADFNDVMESWASRT